LIVANQLEIFASPVDAIVLRMLKRDYTNCKGDGICPWCHFPGCDPKCDLGKLREYYLGGKIEAWTSTKYT